MAETEAALITSVVGALATDDRNHVLVKLVTNDDEELVLAFTPDQLSNFLDVGVKCVTDARRGAPETLIHQTTWFELGKAPDKSFILSLTFGSGGTLSFQLPEGMPALIHETLGVMLGISIPPTPQTPRN